MKAILIAAAFGALLSCSSAFAHAHLTASNPADGAIVASSPAQLSLSFTEGLQLNLSGATLKGPDGAAVPTGPITLGASDDKIMNIALPTALHAGTYSVDWRAFSNDGHTTQGTYLFTVGH